MGKKLTITPGYEDLVEKLGLGDPAAAVRLEKGELVSDSGSSRVFRFRHPERDGPAYYFKVYRYYHVRPMVTYAWRRSRAAREYASLEHLRRHGLPVPEAVAYGVHRTLRVLRSCFVITRAVEGSRGLDRFVADVPASGPAERELRERGIEDLALLVRRMHGSGFFDPNLHFRNILVRQEGGRLRFWFIDHPKGRRIPSFLPLLRRRAVVRDLASLDEFAHRWLRRTERLRFLLRYLDCPRLTRADRSLVRSIARLRARRVARRVSKSRRRSPRPRPWR